MKAKLENIPASKGPSSFYAYRYQVPFFEFKWHYHPEFELTYICKGSGYRIIGNAYSYFSEGDLVLLGTNLPHTWSSNPDVETPSEAIVIQFSQAFISSFLGFTEAVSLQNMLENAKRGICFEPTPQLVSKISNLPTYEKMDRIIELLSILNQLSQMQGKTIASNTFHTIGTQKNEFRINKVCLYIQNNFTKKITLKEVADQIFLTESNFCKFFKKATGKTFSDYLNEIRINEVCRLLIQTEQPINQLSYECGFETLSYFNSVFLTKKGTTPKAFRNQNLKLERQ